MNATQRRLVTEIQQAGLGRYPNPEVKWFRVEEVPVRQGVIVIVSICVGQVGDEGTLAVFRRNQGVFTVGPRGRLEASDCSRGAPKSKLKKYPLIYGWT